MRRNICIKCLPYLSKILCKGGNTVANVDTLVSEVYAGKYGNNPVRQTVLDRRYDEVQAKINAGGTSSRTYTVVSGDNLSVIGQKLGVNWKTIAEKNNISSPYTIYPGQKLKY